MRRIDLQESRRERLLNIQSAVATQESPLRREALGFRADINGLRALAVIGVVVFHMDRRWLPGGFAGVDIFYVISGFLISRIILTECSRSDFSLGTFYAKRAKRILPALIVILAFVIVAGWFWSDPAQYRETGGLVMGNSYFTVNFWLLREAAGGYFALDSTSKTLLHLWSLSIEEQFYLAWAVILLVVFKVRKALTPFVIGAIFVGSLGLCLWLTPRNPVAAFYLPWSRAWELALGSLLAYREVFLLKRLPYPSRGIANLGAALGVALMLGAFFFLSDAEPFPGWRAMIPTLGAALVIAHPRSAWESLLGAPVAAFFGLISYPLYLWHWPLFAFAFGRPGMALTPGATLALGGLAVGLAALTTWGVERPLDAPFKRHRLAVALALVGGLILTGLVGRQIYANAGYPDRFPPLVASIFTFDKGAGPTGPLSQCFYDRDATHYSLEEERERVQRFFVEHRCLEIPDPRKPTILVVGDSHAAHLLSGLATVYDGRANLLALNAVFCAPFAEDPASGTGEGASARCQAIDDFARDEIRRLKPDILILGSYFAEYAGESGWTGPGYLDAFVKAARSLHDEGAPAIIIAGQVPTWSPRMPLLVGHEVLDTGSTPEFSDVGLRPDSLAVDRELKSEDWGPGVTYVSQADGLCAADGCRRLTGASLPDDILAVDYGHYSVNGSLFAIRTIFAPLIDPILQRVSKRGSL